VWCGIGCGIGWNDAWRKIPGYMLYLYLLCMCVMCVMCVMCLCGCIVGVLWVCCGWCGGGIRGGNIGWTFAYCIVTGMCVCMYVYVWYEGHFLDFSLVGERKKPPPLLLFQITLLSPSPPPFFPFFLVEGERREKGRNGMEKGNFLKMHACACKRTRRRRRKFGNLVENIFYSRAWGEWGEIFLAGRVSDYLARISGSWTIL